MRLQFVWWGWAMKFGFERFAGSGLSVIYRWSLGLGPVEIRRWRLLADHKTALARLEQDRTP